MVQWCFSNQGGLQPISFFLKSQIANFARHSKIQLKLYLLCHDRAITPKTNNNYQWSCPNWGIKPVTALKAGQEQCEVEKCKRERNSKGKKKAWKYFTILLRPTRKQIFLSLLLKSAASLAQLAGCYYQRSQLYHSHTTGLVKCHKVLSCWKKKKKNILQTKKREVGRGSKKNNVGEQTDIFGDMSYKLLLGGKNTSSDSSIIVLIEHSSDWQTLCFLKKHRLLSFTRNRKTKIQADRLMVMSNKRWADSQCYTVKTLQYTWN